MKEHTPTPWTTGGESGVLIYGPHGEAIGVFCGPGARGNARRTVQCANACEALVQAAEEIVADLQAFRANPNQIRLPVSKLEQLEAALTKAKE